MKLTIESAINIFNALEGLRQNNDLKFSLAWLIDDNIKALETHATRAQTEQNELLKQFGTLQDEKTQSYQIPPENIPNYQTAFKKVLDFEIEIDLKQIELKELENLSIKAGLNISHLRPIIKESIEQ